MIARATGNLPDDRAGDREPSRWSRGQPGTFPMIRAGNREPSRWFARATGNLPD